MSQKKSFEEKLSKLTLGQNLWLEPMKKWIETSVSICKVAKSDDLYVKKSLLLEIFGSNLKMRQKEVVVNDDQFLISPLKLHWQALRAAREKTARMGGNFSENPNLARPTGFEPAISSVTGRHVNHYTTGP